MPRPQQPGLIHRLFIGNWRNKGTSLMFAVLIWAFAFDNTKQTEQFTVPLRIVSSDPTKVVLRTRGRPATSSRGSSASGRRRSSSSSAMTPTRDCPAGSPSRKPCPAR
jgi:hypothetical protein